MYPGRQILDDQPPGRLRLGKDRTGSWFWLKPPTQADKTTRADWSGKHFVLILISFLLWTSPNTQPLSTARWRGWQSRRAPTLAPAPCHVSALSWSDTVKFCGHFHLPKQIFLLFHTIHPPNGSHIWLTITIRMEHPKSTLQNKAIREFYLFIRSKDHNDQLIVQKFSLRLHEACSSRATSPLHESDESSKPTYWVHQQLSNSSFHKSSFLWHIHRTPSDYEFILYGNKENIFLSCQVKYSPFVWQLDFSLKLINWHSALKKKKKTRAHPSVSEILRPNIITPRYLWVVSQAFP